VQQVDPRLPSRHRIAQFDLARLVVVGREIAVRSTCARVSRHEDQLVVRVDLERGLARTVRKEELLSIALVELEGNRLEHAAMTRIEAIPLGVTMVEIGEQCRLQDHRVMVTKWRWLTGQRYCDARRQNE